jgi:hypothetical protein
MMTKTQTKLLELARTYGGKYSIVTCYGFGPKGGNRTHGLRERDALLQLEVMGLVEITSREPWQEYFSGQGYKQGGNVLSFSLK